MSYQDIINKLPYSEPFLFVDELLGIDDDGAEGLYTFPKDAYFYQGHFKEHPITPGVLLTECMAQIGVVCLGIYLLEKIEKSNTTSEIRINNNNNNLQIALSSSEVDFYAAVFPGEEVRVVSKKLYFRFSKLKCEVRMYNTENVLICQGTIAGMLKATDHA